MKLLKANFVSFLSKCTALILPLRRLLHAGVLHVCLEIKRYIAEMYQLELLHEVPETTR